MFPPERVEPLPLGGADEGGWVIEEPEPDAPDDVLDRSPTDPLGIEDPGIGLTERVSPPTDEPMGDTDGAEPATSDPRPTGGCHPPSTEASHEVGGTNPLRPDDLPDPVDPSSPLDPCTEG